MRINLQMMKEYFNNPEKTQETLKGDWIHTGDIGFYDSDGFFCIVDRTKDLIKVQGMQVSLKFFGELLEDYKFYYRDVFANS